MAVWNRILYLCEAARTLFLCILRRWVAMGHAELITEVCRTAGCKKSAVQGSHQAQLKICCRHPCIQDPYHFLESAAPSCSSFDSPCKHCSCQNVTGSLLRFFKEKTLSLSMSVSVTSSLTLRYTAV